MEDKAGSGSRTRYHLFYKLYAARNASANGTQVQINANKFWRTSLRSGENEEALAEYMTPTVKEEEARAALLDNELPLLCVLYFTVHVLALYILNANI